MIKDKALQEIISLKKLKLVREVFNINESKDFRTGDNVHNALQIEVSIGLDDEDNTIIAYKVESKLIQSTDEINDIHNAVNYISKLEFDYIAFFNLDASYVDEFWKIFKDMNQEENKSEIKRINDYMIDSIYPYLKEHIESVYKKALISIEVPLKIQ